MRKSDARAASWNVHALFSLGLDGDVMPYSQEQLQRCKLRWEDAKAQRRAAHNRVIAAFAHFIADVGSGPTDKELERLKVCVAVEEETAHQYVTLLERCLRG